MNRRTRDDWMEVLQVVYNVASNPMQTAPNALIASAPGKEIHPPILSMPVIHGGQVSIYIQRENIEVFAEYIYLYQLLFKMFSVVISSFTNTQPTKNQFLYAMLTQTLEGISMEGKIEKGKVEASQEVGEVWKKVKDASTKGSTDYLSKGLYSTKANFHIWYKFRK